MGADATLAAVQTFDVQRFLTEREPLWKELEEYLRKADLGGLPALGLAGARRLGVLYRQVSSDLIRARGELVDVAVVDYLNDLVARAYAHIHSGSARPGRQLAAFFLTGFPRLFREEWKAIAISAAITFVGVGVGAAAMVIDPGAAGVLVPEEHLTQTPAERVAEEEHNGGTRLDGSGEGVAFASMLFTHNIQVTFLVFALGVTFGVGTVAVLFANGLPLGALAVHYHHYGVGLFFWAWILPHGIPELTEVIIAGGAGLIVARGLLVPGRRSRKDALIAEARRAVRLVVGGMPILVLAGCIEGTFSQIHEPRLPYVIKLVVAAIIGCAVWAYLLFAGRGAKDEAGQIA